MVVSFSRGRRKKTSPAASIDDPSLLRDLGVGALSGLQYLGEALSKPSRAAWGTANFLTGGEAGGGLLNLIPFSDTMGLTDASKGVELSHVLERTGAIPKNTPGFDWWDVPRLAADIVGDPTTYLGPGVAGKVGRIARKSNVLSDAVRAGRLKGVGPRVTAMNTTLRESLNAVPDVARREKAWKAAEEAAGGATNLLDSLDKPLGSAITMGVPFTGKAMNIGTGAKGMLAARAMDYPGKILRASLPGRVARAMFDPPVGGKVEPAAQATQEAIYHARKNGREAAMEGVFETQQAVREGFTEFMPFAKSVDAGMNIKAAKRAAKTGAGMAFKVGDQVQFDDLLGEIANVTDKEYHVHHRSLETGAEQIFRVPKANAAERLSAAASADPFVRAAAGRNRNRVLQEATAAMKNNPGRLAEEMRVVDAAATDWAQKTGRRADEFYEGLTVKHGDKTTVGKNALFQGEEPVFYSKLRRAVNEIPDGRKVTLQELEGSLKKKGVKGTEMEYADLKSAYGDARFMTKDQIKQHLDKNTLGLSEEVIEDTALSGSALEDAGRLAKTYDDAFEADDLNLLPQSELDALKAGPVKDLYSAAVARREMLREQLSGEGGWADYGKIRKTTANAKTLVIRGSGLKSGIKEGDQHYKDALGYVRFGDQVRPDGKKILHIENIQSDWAQQAEGAMNLTQEMAAASGKYADEMRALEKALFDEKSMGDARAALWDQVQKGFPPLQNMSDDALEAGHRTLNRFGNTNTKALERAGMNKDAIYEAAATLGEEINRRAKAGTNVATKHPFGKNWYEPMMRRVMRYAADNGYDGVSWSSAAEQAKRWQGGNAEYFKILYDEKIPSFMKKEFKAKIDNVLPEMEGPLPANASAYGPPIIPGAKGVMFDDAIRGQAHGKQPLFQDSRGAIEFDDVARTATITLFDAADITTFAHETAHLFRRRLAESDPVLLKQAADALGVKTWDRAAEELFASGYERYRMTGKAPNAALKSVFVKFKEWMAGIYATIVGTPLEKKVPAKLKEVFDKMLSPADVDLAGSMSLGRTRAYSAYEKMVRALGENMPMEKAWSLVKKQLRLPKNTKLPQNVVDAAQKAADKLRARRNEKFQVFLDMGGNSDWMKQYDPGNGGASQAPRYVAKKIADEMIPMVTAKSMGSAGFASAKRREDTIRNIFTGSLNDMLKNPRVRDMATGPDAVMKEYGNTGKIDLNPKWSEGKNPDEVFSPKQQADLQKIDAEVQAGKITLAEGDVFKGIVNKQAHAEALAQWARDHAKRDIFTRDMAADEIAYHSGIEKAIATQTAIHDVVHSFAQPADTIGGVTLADAFRRAGMKESALTHQAQLLGVTVDEAKLMTIPEEVAQSIVAVEMMSKAPPPPWKREIQGAYDKFTRLFKESVTTQPLMPGYFVRNALSGLFQNIASGEIKNLSDLKLYIQSALEAYRGAKGYERELQVVFGYDDFLGEMRDFQQNGLHGVGFDQKSVVPPMPSLARARQEAGEFVAENPSGVRGWDPVRKAWGANTGLGQQMNASVEHMNRVPMYLYLRKKGFSTTSAKEVVDRVQFDYSDLSPFEKDYMRRIMPFYSFSKKQAEFMAQDLVDYPGGVTGSLLKTFGGRDDLSPDTPDHVAASVAINMGQLPDGSKRYLTGLGLPVEDTAKLVANPLTDTLSRLNPLIKGPIEAATGRSLFQSGRDLRDMDGTLGRLGANVGGLTGLTEGKDPIPVPRAIEQVVVNTPASKALNTLRMMTDPRKSVWDKLLQFSTGIRKTDVSPGAQAATLQQRVDDAAREAGGKAFTRVSFPKDRAPTPQQEKFQAVYRELARRAKERAAQRKRDVQTIQQSAVRP